MRRKALAETMFTFLCLNSKNTKRYVSYHNTPYLDDILNKIN